MISLARATRFDDYHASPPLHACRLNIFAAIDDDAALRHAFDIYRYYAMRARAAEFIMNLSCYTYGSKYGRTP